MKIEERWPCPRCGYQRRMLWGARTYVCFNCRFQTDSPDGHVQFSDAELARLTMYRAAVHAGVYSDEVKPTANSLPISQPAGIASLGPARLEGGGASWAPWRRRRSPGCRRSCGPYASSVIDGGIMPMRACTVNGTSVATWLANWS
jgi:hypothetical protein